MRQDRIIQASIFDLFSEHEIGRELKAMSAWLDAHREVIALVAAELCRPGLKPTGRDGLPAESVLRLVPEEVGPARDDQRDQRPDLGADQSLFIGQRQRDQGRDRHAAAPG